MKTTSQLLLVGMLLILSACHRRTPLGSDTGALEQPVTPPKPVVTKAEAVTERRVEIARQMLKVITRERGEDLEWQGRQVKTELRPLLDELYLMHLEGMRPVHPAYETGHFTKQDLAELDLLQMCIQENPQLALEIEQMLRSYDLMTCETLDAAMRSWLAIR